MKNISIEISNCHTKMYIELSDMQKFLEESSKNIYKEKQQIKKIIKKIKYVLKFKYPI